MKYIKKFNWSAFMVAVLLVASGLLSSCQKSSTGGQTGSGGGTSAQSVVTVKGASN